MWPKELYKDFGPQFDVGNVHSRASAIYLNISDQCPLNCGFCRYQIDDDYLKNNKQIMSQTTFETVVNKCVDYGVWYYSLMCLFGEPFMDKNIYSKLEYMESNPGVKSYNIPSNFVPVTEDSIDKLLQLKKGLLKISVYGHDRDTYKQFTNMDLFDKMYNNLEMLYNKLIDEPCMLKVTIMMKNQKLDDTYPAGKMHLLLRKLSLLKNVRIDNYEVYVSNRAITSDVKMSDTNTKRGVCSSGTVGIVYPNGDVGYCYYCDVYRKHKMGNLLEQTLHEIYNQGPYKQLIHNMKNNVYNDVCTRCDFFSPAKSEILDTL